MVASVGLKKWLVIAQQCRNSTCDSMAHSIHRLIGPIYPVLSKHANTFPPTLYSWIQFYVEGEWIRLASGYWRYVILVSIDKRDNLYGYLLQR